MDAMLRQNWSTLHNCSIDLNLRRSAKAARDKLVKGQGADHSGSTGGGLAQCHCILAGEFSIFEPRF
jgi:hypothetical protein